MRREKIAKWALTTLVVPGCVWLWQDYRAEERKRSDALQTQLEKINGTLGDLKVTVATTAAGKSYQDEQIQSLRADLVALQRECSRRWERAN
jgi:septal ring factor EnvC (AmiA/AmiB activator)